MRQVLNSTNVENLGDQTDNLTMDAKKVLKDIKGSLRPNKVAFNLRLDPELKADLIKIAKAEGLGTVNALSEGILKGFRDDYLKRAK